ncbi:hypothetical protein Pcinc_010303 [Petrolisthes cinctipes]|uniref:Uncharacterized protein n=1 Tax=Petrolisthes cinctipes TaxID=88211 RepID=A0AAE1G3C4_PETCI|nr:hypothetical protein Pcinc_010303 [Petrolisthes cinctipes]
MNVTPSLPPSFSTTPYAFHHPFYSPLLFPTHSSSFCHSHKSFASLLCPSPLLPNPYALPISPPFFSLHRPYALPLSPSPLRPSHLHHPYVLPISPPSTTTPTPFPSPLPPPPLRPSLPISPPSSTTPYVLSLPWPCPQERLTLSKTRTPAPVAGRVGVP